MGHVLMCGEECERQYHMPEVNWRNIVIALIDIS